MPGEEVLADQARFGRGLRVLLVPAVLWLSPAIAFAIVLPLALTSESAQLAPSELPSTQVVGERARDLQLEVVAAVAYAPEQVIVSPASGTVVDVAAAIGEPVLQAAPLVNINGIQILAEVGGSPLYRELRQGDRGPDVATLRGLLRARGFDVLPDGDRFDASMTKAVRVLRTSLGAPTGSSFEPTFVVHFPAGAIIAEAAVSVGEVVGTGTPLFKLQRSAGEVTLKPFDATQRLDRFGDAPVTLSLGDKEIELSSVVLTDDDRAVLAAFIGDGLADGVMTLDESGHVVGLKLSLSEPVVVGTVPVRAVLSSPHGTLCVYALDGDEYKAVRLDRRLQSAEIGIAYVPRSLVGQRVSLRPSELDAAIQQTC
jgi:hypothetical protein